ncbi:grasp-with-spasm system SPASM domain peptide maturase [Chryseobacterium taichungense]|uniref:grasp-with-spasm system SPASM domain peptide maturase n=1 Tax=Chryseobacterium taichungense TaxID=295069 RepID=UPI0028AFDF3D|nr:grasp-with-spasm system SPASM domain peptide maturase [Chryseobacterium taichungense]
MFFKLFSNCILVDGPIRSTICDMQREEIFIIHSDFADVIRLLFDKSLEEVKHIYGDENKEIIDDYIDFLLENELGFYCNNIDEFNSFPKLSMEYHSTSRLSNIVVELSEITIINFQKIADAVNLLGCKDIVLISYDFLDLLTLEQTLDYLHDSCIKSIEIITKYDQEVDSEFINVLNRKMSQLTRLIFHTSPEEKHIRWNKEILFDSLFTTRVIDSFNHCGIVNADYFTKTSSHILESVNHNSCLNKKLSVDIFGNIKNCPAMSEIYGNILSDDLTLALDQTKLNKYWNISKNQIKVCSDCEFRLVCTDCRAYTERSDFNQDGVDISKPLKCGYNPYKATWEDWRSNPIKSAAIKYYNFDVENLHGF